MQVSIARLGKTRVSIIDDLLIAIGVSGCGEVNVGCSKMGLGRIGRVGAGL